MRKKLIEVALPLEAINRESAREKPIRHGHPSTLHLWWVRPPLAACRAVLFASLLDDPYSRPSVNPESRRSLLGAQASRLPFFEDTWRSRGYLPHFDKADLVQSITFRLADSLPRGFLDRCEQELAALPAEQRVEGMGSRRDACAPTELEKRVAAWLDRGEGDCHLRDPRVAELVENALLHFDGQRYRLIAWCVMPNHVHAMIETMPGHPLDHVLHSWKSFTAKEANRLLDRAGAFWQTEYHDRFIRNDAHFANAKRYIEENPVKAGLVASADNWRWSSAWKGRKAGGTPALPA